LVRRLPTYGQRDGGIERIAEVYALPGMWVQDFPEETGRPKLLVNVTALLGTP
jgi:hypothetical protein